MPEEILDLVNESDEIIGTAPRSEIHEKNMRNFRAVNLMIVNEEGKIWIPRRTKHKKLFPNALDMSMGGHVSSGETYDQALIRETMEELNLDLTKLPYRFLGKLTPHENGSFCFVHCYELRMNESPNYNPEDYTEFYWLTPQEILDRIAGGEPSKSDLPVVVRHFYI